MDFIVFEIVLNSFIVFSICRDQLVVGIFAVVAQHLGHTPGILVLTYNYDMDFVSSFLSGGQDGGAEYQVPYADCGDCQYTFVEKEMTGKAVEQHIDGSRQHAYRNQALQERPYYYAFPVGAAHIDPYGHYHHRYDETYNQEVQRPRAQQDIILRISEMEHLQQPLENADMNP